MLGGEREITTKAFASNPCWWQTFASNPRGAETWPKHVRDMHDMRTCSGTVGLPTYYKLLRRTPKESQTPKDSQNQQLPTIRRPHRIRQRVQQLPTICPPHLCAGTNQRESSVGHKPDRDRQLIVQQPESTVEWESDDHWVHSINLCTRYLPEANVCVCVCVYSFQFSEHGVEPTRERELRARNDHKRLE